MPHQTPLQQAVTEALQAAASAAAEDNGSKAFSPTPDGYYARTDTPETEIAEALAELGIHPTSRPI